MIDEVTNSDKVTIDICEWCGMSYLRGSWDYYEVVVFDKPHKICSDCKDHLMLVK